METTPLKKSVTIAPGHHDKDCISIIDNRESNKSAASGVVVVEDHSDDLSLNKASRLRKKSSLSKTSGGDFSLVQKTGMTSLAPKDAGAKMNHYRYSSSDTNMGLGAGGNYGPETGPAMMMMMPGGAGVNNRLNRRVRSRRRSRSMRTQSTSAASNGRQNSIRVFVDQDIGHDSGGRSFSEQGRV